MSEATIPIKELMEKTEQWLLGQGYKKSTLGFYRATSVSYTHLALITTTSLSELRLVCTAKMASTSGQ